MHGNDFAFEKVEADIKQQDADQIVCLGDAIQGGAQPSAVVERLRRLHCPVVMGNADDWLITGIDSGREAIPPERLKKMDVIREWSLSQLTHDDLKFMKSFQPTVSITLENNLDLLCFHGSPADFDDVIRPSTPEDEFRKFLSPYDKNILAGGHTHTQQVRRCGELFFFNPGSVGFAYSSYQPDGQFLADAWAEYAILSIENGDVGLQFRRLPYDAKDVIEIYRKSGRPFAEDAIAQYKR
jgi:putative phosphoesterase